MAKEIDIKRAGFEAYEIYRKAVGGRAYNGVKLPVYTELGKRQQDGWEAVGMAINPELVPEKPKQKQVAGVNSVEIAEKPKKKVKVRKAKVKAKK